MQKITLLFFATLLSATLGISKELSLTTKDHYILKAWLNFPAQKRSKYPLAIIAHQFSSDHTKWIHFAQELRARGYATLNIDLRGHGASIMQNGKINKILPYTSMEDLKNSIVKSAKKVGFQHISSDLSAWINYVQDHYKNKIDSSDISFFGASLGAGGLISLIFDYQPKIAIFYSPGSTDEVGGTDAIADVTAPIMFISSKNDFALQRTLKYAHQANDPTVLILPGSGHGEVLMQKAQAYVDLFLRKNGR
jgi:dienelactone hydrolase